MTLLAGAAAAVAYLLLGWRPGRGRPRTEPAPGRAGLGVAAGAVAALVILPVDARVVAWAGIAASMVVGGALVRRRQLRHRAVAEARGRVLETCELLSAELRAGQPPGVALRLAAAEWPALTPVVEAFELGADVPDRWRLLAEQLVGARELRILAAAWQVAYRTGHGLAAAVELVAADLRAARATDRVIESELASARATARLVAVLPLLALLMGQGAGGDPWRFLLLTSPGLLCLAAGIALMVAGLWWIESIAAGVWQG